MSSEETSSTFTLPMGAYGWYNSQGKAPLLVLCDHAINTIPPELGNLGVSVRDRQRHVAYDIGALPVAKIIAEALDAPLIYTTTSRLVLDPNRNPSLNSFIPEKSDDVIITANQGLSKAQKKAREDQLFTPYHQAIEARLDQMEAQSGKASVLISVHSFTPQLACNSALRPWHYGILWEEDDRIAKPLITALEALSDAPVGENQPYSARDIEGETIRRHGTQRGLASALIEVRQDLIENAQGQRQHALLLLQALRPVLINFDYTKR